jgi:hypothetical protein
MCDDKSSAPFSISENSSKYKRYKVLGVLQ